jgi:hypothetical protein
VIIPLDKLLTYENNKYVFSRACMEAVEKIGNIRQFPEDSNKWKVVPNILKLVLNDNLHYRCTFNTD